MYFDWNCQLRCEFECLHFCFAENVDYFSLSPLLQESGWCQSSLQNGSFGLFLITRQFKERRTRTEPCSLLIPFHQPVITLQLHIFKGFFSPSFSVLPFNFCSDFFPHLSSQSVTSPDWEPRGKKYVKWGVAGRAEPMNHGCPYAGVCSPSLVPSWHSFPAVLFCAQQLSQGWAGWKSGEKLHVGLRDRRKEGEKAGIENHFILENTKGGNFNKCQMVRINQRHVKPYVSNCLLWQGSFSFLNESLPGTLFFLAFPFAHPLDLTSYPHGGSSLLGLFPGLSSPTAAHDWRCISNAALCSGDYPCMGTSLLLWWRGVPVQ